MAMSSLAHCRRLAGSWHLRGRHHELNSPPCSYPYPLRQSPGHHDYLSRRGITEYSKEVLGQTVGISPIKDQGNLSRWKNGQETLLDVVKSYDSRFSLGLTDQEEQDLVEYLKSL